MKGKEKSPSVTNSITVAVASTDNSMLPSHPNNDRCKIDPKMTCNMLLKTADLHCIVEHKGKEKGKGERAGKGLEVGR